MIHISVNGTAYIIFIQDSRLKFFKKIALKMWLEVQAEPDDSVTTENHLFFLHNGDIVIVSRNECPIETIVYSNSDPYDYMRKVQDSWRD